jgi:protein-tyrosine phosphatase
MPPAMMGRAGTRLGCRAAAGEDGAVTQIPEGRPYRVCFVCTGNICRSPMAEIIFRALAERAGLGRRIEVDSAGMGNWHVAGPADRRALRALTDAGYDGAAHRARLFDPLWFADRDLVVALDRGHLRALRQLARSSGADTEVRLLRSFDPALTGRPDADLDVADPYYEDHEAFARVLEQVERACEGLLRHVEAELAGRSTHSTRSGEDRLRYVARRAADPPDSVGG